MVFCGNKEYDFVLYALLWEHNNLVFTERFQNNTQCVFGLQTGLQTVYYEVSSTDHHYYTIHYY